MKKFVLITLIILMTISAVSALNPKFSLILNPYTFTKYDTTDSTETANKSKYGLGGGAGFVTDFKGSGVLVGADIVYDVYAIEDNFNFSDLFVTARVGYEFYKAPRFSIEAYAKLGIDFQSFKDFANGLTPVLGAGFEAEFNTADRLSIYAAVEGNSSFTFDHDITYTAFRLNTVIGAKYAF